MEYTETPTSFTSTLYYGLTTDSMSSFGLDLTAAAVATTPLHMDYATTSTTAVFEEDDCQVPYMADRRWYLVAVVGTSLSFISLICNILIAKILLRPKHSHFFFLGLLALSDSFLSFCYGPVISMEVMENRLQILWLTRLWWKFVGPLLAACHVSMTFSCALIILATIERYLITVKSPVLLCFRQNRGLLALLMFLISLMLRGTAVFEVTLVKNGNCTGFTEYTPSLTPLVHTWIYGTVFRFYIRTIATVFIPFFLLAYLNFRIVDTLRRQKRHAAMFRFGTSEHKYKIRSATRLLVLIVCSYLLANVLNVFITAWEYVDLESTQTEITYDIYETLTDVISMLYVLTCATRLAVYIICNQEIRSAFYEFLCKSSNCKSGSFDDRLEYKPIKKNLSPTHGFLTMGTEFDRVVVAMALASRKTSMPKFYANGGIPPLALHEEEAETSITRYNVKENGMNQTAINNHASNKSEETKKDPRITIIENPLVDEHIR